jgi:hypothetical protein
MCEPDIRLARFINMGAGRGEKRRPCTDYYRLWTLFNGDAPKRGQAMAFDVFVGKFCLVVVETVTKDAREKDLPGLLRYSVVRDVLKVWEP